MHSEVVIAEGVHLESSRRGRRQERGPRGDGGATRKPLEQKARQHERLGPLPRPRGGEPMIHTHGPPSRSHCLPRARASGPCAGRLVQAAPQFAARRSPPSRRLSSSSGLAPEAPTRPSPLSLLRLPRICGPTSRRGCRPAPASAPTAPATSCASAGASWRHRRSQPAWATGRRLEAAPCSVGREPLPWPKFSAA